jgi:hypothetical protein
MAALRALHPDRKARGYSQKDVSCATRKMGSALVFFAARLAPPLGALFFLGYGRFELCLFVRKPAAKAVRIDQALDAIFIRARQFLRKARDLRMAGSQISGFIESSMRNVRR